MVLVLLTALVIGLGFEWFVAGATLAVGVAVGAAVAPPDPVAALAVGRKVGLPPRLVTLIQGEGLLNDATALTLLSVAVAAATRRRLLVPGGGRQVRASWRPAGSSSEWSWPTSSGCSARSAKDPLIANAVSLATPFAAYLLAEAVHVSGVLAVVVAGLIVGHDAPRTTSGASRLQTSAVWRLVDFLLEGFVFLLIGQQLPAVVRGLDQYSTTTIVIAVSHHRRRGAAAAAAVAGADPVAAPVAAHAAGQRGAAAPTGSPAARSSP